MASLRPQDLPSFSRLTWLMGLYGENYQRIARLLDLRALEHPGAWISGAGNGLDNIVQGGAGSQQLYGGGGQDILIGGAGADTFHTFTEAGYDVVADFNLPEGDRVQLALGTQYMLGQEGSNTVIRIATGGEMLLVGVQLSSLTPGWIFIG